MRQRNKHYYGYILSNNHFIGSHSKILPLGRK